MANRVTFEELISFVNDYRLIAISGFGGAGKSTAAAKLAKRIAAVVISADNFSLGQQRSRNSDWSSIDRDRLAEQVLKPANAGEAIRYQKYDWPNDRLGEWETVDVQSKLIIEGIGIIHPDVEGYLDLSVWLDVPLEIAGERGKYRDREIYKVEHDELWDTIWIPNDRDYFNKYRPDERADFILQLA